MTWRRHLAYLRYIARHKYYVWRGCRLVGHIPWWRAILHDWDRFLPDEWRPYAETFYAPDGSRQYTISPQLATAWNRHQKRNRHHWQHWLLTQESGETDVLIMPATDVREMAADWIGGGWAIQGTPDPWPWYLKNGQNVNLHPASRELLEELLLDVRRKLSRRGLTADETPWMDDSVPTAGVE